MAELRRILVKPLRLIEVGDERTLRLNKNETHYLLKVLRLKASSYISVVDGLGHLWEANILQPDLLQFTSPINEPLKEISKSHPLICLAVVVPKKGSDVILKMCTEIGVDIFQPLRSERSVLRYDSDIKLSRWKSIIRRSVEQSERLWEPEIRSTLFVNEWLSNMPAKSQISFAVTRSENSIDFQHWLRSITNDTNQIWIVIGPEGGWTTNEQSLANAVGCDFVQLGDSILTTSTAAVASTELLASWRRN